MDANIMIDVIKKVFSTYQPGDMGLDLRDVIATQEEIIKILEMSKWHYDDPSESGDYIVQRSDEYRCPIIIDYYSKKCEEWDSSEHDVIRWKSIYYGDIDAKMI
jgi:hypothetical protein